MLEFVRRVVRQQFFPQHPSCKCFHIKYIVLLRNMFGCNIFRWQVNCLSYHTNGSGALLFSATLPGMNNMPLRKLWALLLLAPTMCLASVEGLSRRVLGGQPSLADREHRVWTSAVRHSEFAAAPYTRARISCEITHPPQAWPRLFRCLINAPPVPRSLSVSSLVPTVACTVLLFWRAPDPPGTAPFWMRYAPGAIARPRVMGFPARPRRRSSFRAAKACFRLE